MTEDLIQAINQYGFPIVAAIGMGGFIWYVWIWTTTVVEPSLSAATATLIKLIDRVRMLDNDLIRLNVKLAMILEYKQDIEKSLDKNIDSELADILQKKKSSSGEDV